MKSDGLPVVYAGTPGTELLDLRAWVGLYDAAVAIERVPTYIRQIRFNFDRYGLGALPHWVVRQRIEDFLALKGEEAEQVFDGIPAWPCLVNYDPFDNPLPMNARTFPRDRGLWASLKSFLQFSPPSFKGGLLLATCNVRGPGSIYDSAIHGICEEARQHTADVTQDYETRLVASPMARKIQLCLPHWLRRYATTHTGFQLELLDSIAYPGTERATMVHLVMSLVRTDRPESPIEPSVLRLLNFPHEILRPMAGGGWSRTTDAEPVVRRGMSAGGQATPSASLASPPPTGNSKSVPAPTGGVTGP